MHIAYSTYFIAISIIFNFCRANDIIGYYWLFSFAISTYGFMFYGKYGDGDDRYFGVLIYSILGYIATFIGVIWMIDEYYLPGLGLFTWFAFLLWCFHWMRENS
jgi:hypothetical protein